MMKMNLKEINELMVEVFKCRLENLKSFDMFWLVPNPRVADSLADGFKLVIDPSALDDSDLNCIEVIVQKLKLKLTKTTKHSREYFIIYKSRGKS